MIVSVRATVQWTPDTRCPVQSVDSMPSQPAARGQHAARNTRYVARGEIWINITSLNFLPGQTRVCLFIETNTAQIFYVWVSVHHKLIYIKRTNVMQFGSMFICNCNIALHISDAFCVHLHEHLETVEAGSGEWYETGWGIQQGVQGRWHPH